MRQTIPLIAAGLAASMMVCAPAAADGLADYNHPYGMAAGQETQTANPSLRDANGNLTVVNGQFTSSTFSQQSGVQTAQSGVGGSSGGSSGGLSGNASAVGNSLNVITTGSNNTVVVESKQINNGNQTAAVNVNGH